MKNNNMPRTPFSTPLSGSARETELRLRNIFSGPKKRPPALFLALVFAACLLCGNLVSCQMKEAEQTPSETSVPPGDISQPKEPEYLPASELSFDLNHNGIPEEIRLENEYGWDEVRFYENGQLTDREQPGVCLYRPGDADFILRYTLDEYPGSFHYYYSYSSFNSEFETPLQWHSIQFDTNFSAPFHKSFDVEEIAGFMDNLNRLLAQSVRLSNVDGELVAEKPEPEGLDFLDSFPDIFTRDPDKSLEENLRDFQAAMTAAYPGPEPLGEAEVLPFGQPMEMIFLSGAGAWCTGLDLNPDGSFTADYHDSDGPIQYVCQFHGKLGNFVQLTEHSWSLTLEELVLDTKYPVGTEWDEDGFHKISSQPAGFTDGEGNALQPGARFILYSPEAKGDRPGTELYGARDLWEWCLSRPDIAGGQPLGCWDLYNLASDIGFFSQT